MGASKFKARLEALVGRIADDFDRDDIAPTLAASEKGLASLEKIVGYCEDKLKAKPE